MLLQGKDHDAGRRARPGHDRGRAEAQGDGAPATCCSDADKPARIEPLAVAGAGRLVRDRAAHKGDEDKVYSALRRLAEEDPSLDVHRDPAHRRDDRGAGLSQMHVEVTLERLSGASGWR